jgi:hypothetical protein
LHEQIEAKRVEKLIARLKADRILKNPPIATPALNADTARAQTLPHARRVRDCTPSETGYIVLDGASRTAALQALHCRDILVQIVDYHSPQLTLEAWHHLLVDTPLDAVWREISLLPDVSVETMEAARAREALARREIIGFFLLPDGRVRALRGANDLPSQARVLNQVVAAYEGRGQMYRVAHTNLETLVAEHHRLDAVVVFPRYHPDEIVHLALNGAKLPMGITRHIIPGRALRINLPLDILESDQPLEEKNTWLDEWLKEKIRERRVRFYQEPVFLFDE